MYIYELIEILEKSNPDTLEETKSIVESMP